jgi:hypothetical protein
MRFSAGFCLLIALPVPGFGQAAPKVKEAWQPLASGEVGGLLGERLELWRTKRLWKVAADPQFLAPFEGGPGSHNWKSLVGGRAGQGESPGSSPLWQGEHVGKWLHAATLAHEATHEDKLLAALKDTVRRLVNAQHDNGYLGTYAPAKRFYAPPDADTWRSWDIWTHRYNLYGLLTYERFHPDASVVRACVRMGDLLLEAFGPGKRDMTQVGTRRGMSSGTLLESVMMLYERTGEPRFLEFARHIVRMSEDNPQFRLLSAMLARQDVSGPGDGKAYQLMAVLLGYGELYRHSADRSFLHAAVNGWENIRQGHLYETGGPWSFAHVSYKNNECFAPPAFFDPSRPVETCSATTWTQLSLQLLRITGEARYAAEAERTVLNQIAGAQAPDGIGWSTHPPANAPARGYVQGLDCCASSGPRALEMMGRHLVGATADAVSIASYLPSVTMIPSRGLKLCIRGNYPFDSRVSVTFEMANPGAFPVDFSLPSGARSLRVRVGGRALKPTLMPSGFHRLRRTWQPGDRAEVSFDFPVMEHVHAGSGGKRWVSFTHGPLVLAAERESEPASGQGAASAWVEQSNGGFRLKHGGPALTPYHRTGSSGSGVYMYFPLRP